MAVEDLLAAMDEMDEFEGRQHLAGEAMQAQIEMRRDDGLKGARRFDPAFAIAEPGENERGLIRLSVFACFGMPSTLTAYRSSVREAIANLGELARLEARDASRYGGGES